MSEHAVVFTSVTLKNFLSFGAKPTTFRLDQPGTTLITGENLDDTSFGKTSNGAGKSTIINGISYALYDKPVSNIGKDNLINNINKKNMEVSIEFTKGEYFYKITRIRKGGNAGRLNTVIVYRKKGSNNFTKEDSVTPDSVGNANKLIKDYIGVDYDLFVRIVVFSATNVPFLELPTSSHYQANQIDIIEELFDLKRLSEKAELLKTEVKQSEQSLVIHQERIKLLEEEQKKYKSQLESAKNRITNWNIQRKEQVDILTEKLKKIADVNIDDQKELHNLLAEYKSTLSTVVRDKKTADLELSKSKKKVKDLTNELTHLQDEKCPYCLQQYKEVNEKINAVSQGIEDNSKLSEKTQLLLDELIADQTILEEEIVTTKNKITVPNIDELIDIKSQSTAFESKLKDLKSSTNPYVEPLEELKSMKPEDIDYTEVNRLSKLIDHQRMLLKLLTKKDSFVRKILVSKNIPFLNNRLQEYLHLLGMTHKVEFTEHMTADITLFGRLLDFGQLSHGQQARVNIALSFAFRDVLQNMHGKINLCLLDEVLDEGLDTVGVQLAARMLKRKARDEKACIYIISHRDEVDSAFDRILNIQMKKGFSSVEGEREVPE
jgi:DNA repair exonuclease SbcCD ATPase subunit